MYFKGQRNIGPSATTENASQNKTKTKVTESTAWQKIDDSIFMEVLENTIIDITDDNNKRSDSGGVLVLSKKHDQEVLDDTDDFTGQLVITPSASTKNASQNKTKVTESTSAWQKIDDNIFMEVLENTIIDITDDDDFID